MGTDLLEPSWFERDKAYLHELFVHLHQHPELSMQEHETAQLMRARLDAFGYHTVAVGETGIVGVLENGEGPVVAFRADMDGLPLKEETHLSYASKAGGVLSDGTDVSVMHACGHDIHMSCALGAAKQISESRDAWAGTVVFIFQPGEETGEGAAAMIASGLWDRVAKPSVILAQHVWTIQSGTIQITERDVMAYSDVWRIVIQGSGGHASRPDQAINPLQIASSIIQNIEIIKNSVVDPRFPSVVSPTMVHGGTNGNIIPASAEIVLNLRTTHPDVRRELSEALRGMISNVALAFGGAEPRIEAIASFPVLKNDPEEARRVATAVRKELPDVGVSSGTIQMGSEDFGHLAESIGAKNVYWFLGGISKDRLATGPVPYNHSPEFYVDMEPTIETGTKVAVEALRACLRPVKIDQIS